MSDTHTRRVPGLAPDVDLEYVGAHSEPLGATCAGIVSEDEAVEDLEYCDAEATHTIVERDDNGGLHEISLCDSCGEPDDAERR